MRFTYNLVLFTNKQELTVCLIFFCCTSFVRISMFKDNGTHIFQLRPRPLKWLPIVAASTLWFSIVRKI
jgi:hypothetical protein